MVVLIDERVVMLQSMKIKIDSVAQCIAVQQALFTEGYEWACSGKNILSEYDMCRISGIFAYPEGRMYHAASAEDGYFESHRNPEYHLNQAGIFVQGPKPTLKELLIAKIEQDEGAGIVTFEKPPVGLRPLKIVQHQRAIEIIDAMRRYAEASCVIPVEWFTELDDLNEALKKENGR